MAMFQLLLLTTLVVGSFADHHPLHVDYALPHSQVNFRTPSNTFKIPDVAAPVLPSFVEIESSAPRHVAEIPSTSYGIPVGPVRQTPALVRPSPPKTIEITDSGEIETDLFDIFGGPQSNVDQFLEYNPPITTRKPTTTTTTTRRPTTTTTTTRKPTTTTTTPTTTTYVPTTPAVVYGEPEKPATEYFVPTTTTTTTTTTPRPTTTTTTTTTTTPRPTTTTTTTTTPRPTTTVRTTLRPTTTPTTTTERVEIYGPPDVKPPKPFSDYGPPMDLVKPFNKPSYPYPAAGVPDLRYQHHQEQPHLVPTFLVRHVSNPYGRISGAHFVPIQIPRYVLLN